MGHDFAVTEPFRDGQIGSPPLAGLATATFLRRLTSSQLFEVSPFDPATFVIAALPLAITALKATLVPTWRASSVDPATALRKE